MTQETTKAPPPAQALVRGSGSNSDVAPRPSSGGAGADNVGGTTQIADAVVARIAGLAAREVAGVHDMSTSGAGSAFATLTGRVTGQDQADKGVSVEVGQSECIVDLAIVVDFGASIPQISDALRRNVSARLAAMTGLTAKEININVTDLFVSPQAQPQDAQQTRVQ
jgi:uncharacterized alkaline shock family protein YloU